MTMYWVSEAKLAQFLGGKGGESTYLPVSPNALGWLEAGQAEASVEALAAARTGQSPKGMFFPTAESVGRYGPAAEAATAVETRPVVLMGLRACELRALKYLDKVFLGGDFQDPTYAARREAMTLVSVDCADCRETCCCTLVGGRPFATEGYDVNLTPMDGGFLADVATDRGRDWLGEQAASLREAAAEQTARRDELREEMTERVRAQNAEFTFAAADDKPPPLPNDDDASWQAFAADCVECAGCTNGCPTCHCFYLYDQSAGPKDFERVRTWDSCLLSSYHRMAGTVPHMKPTPRPRLRSRLANRVLHKFSYSPEQYGLLGCVGCGRCIEGCLGAIDIRRVVQELSR